MMIRITSFLTIAFSVLRSVTFAQQPGGPDNIIVPYPLEITIFKTTNLVFPFSIISVDKGSKAILAQKAKGADNILQVKAANENFEETNLTVVTTDGHLYSYLVNYSPYPEKLNLVFSKQAQSQAVLSQPQKNEAIIEETAASVAAKEKTIRKVRDKKYGVMLGLEGLYIKEDVFYYQLKITNNTHVGYDIDQLRFFVRDKKRSKRTATQELEQLPIYVHGNTHKVEGNTESVLVFALPKQTIPDKKYLAVQLMEGSGGRHLKLKLGNKILVKALPFE
jgi:conjugative transposon TraN protein